MTNTELTAFGDKIRECFINEKRKVLPNFNIAAGHQDKVFQKAAEFVSGLNADPEMYVFAQFYFKPKSEQMLMQPQFLYSLDAVENFDRLADTIQNTISLDTIYNEDLMMLEAQKRLGFTEEEILRSMTFQFTPWFRLCYSKEPIPKLMANNALRKKARAEFNDELKTFLISKKMDYKRITLWTEPT